MQIGEVFQIQIFFILAVEIALAYIFHINDASLSPRLNRRVPPLVRGGPTRPREIPLPVYGRRRLLFCLVGNIYCLPQRMNTDELLNSPLEWIICEIKVLGGPWTMLSSNMLSPQDQVARRGN